MQRYFLNELNGLIEGDDVKHITKVMRMKVADEIIVCANEICYTAKLVELNNNFVKYELLELLANIKQPEITLIQGLPKYSKIDFVVKYATIFGATKIIFTKMHRSEAKINQIEAKVERYLKISKEAAELAHRNNYAKIEFLKDLNKLKFNEFDLVLYADELSKDMAINYPIRNINEHSKIALIIGPEGGITNEERIMLKNNSSIPISLGTHILPTEAASLYALSVISAKYLKFV